VTAKFATEQFSPTRTVLYLSPARATSRFFPTEYLSSARKSEGAYLRSADVKEPDLSIAKRNTSQRGTTKMQTPTNEQEKGYDDVRCRRPTLPSLLGVRCVIAKLYDSHHPDDEAEQHHHRHLSLHRHHLPVRQDADILGEQINYIYCYIQYCTAVASHPPEAVRRLGILYDRMPTR